MRAFYFMRFQLLSGYHPIINAASPHHPLTYFWFDPLLLWKFWHSLRKQICIICQRILRLIAFGKVFYYIIPFKKSAFCNFSNFVISNFVYNLSMFCQYYNIRIADSIGKKKWYRAFISQIPWMPCLIKKNRLFILKELPFENSSSIETNGPELSIR